METRHVFSVGEGDSRTIIENSLDEKIDAITLYNSDSLELKTTKKIAKKIINFFN